MRQSVWSGCTHSQLPVCDHCLKHCAQPSKNMKTCKALLFTSSNSSVRGVMASCALTHHCQSVSGVQNTTDDSRIEKNCLVVMIVANTSAPYRFIV